MGINIDTKEYIGEKRVIIDGNDWLVKLPGAGTDLAISQKQRRATFLENKIKSGKYDEKDLDLLDEIETYLVNTMKKMFSDGTPDNASVEKWFDETPSVLIFKVFDDIKRKAQESEATEAFNDTPQQTADSTGTPESS
jgi:hypothetical protein